MSLKYEPASEPQVHYPSKGADVPFWLALQRMLYGYGLLGKAKGLYQLLSVHSFLFFFITLKPRVE